MERSVVAYDAKLPGYDARQSITHDIQAASELLYEAESYERFQDHRAYLENKTYDKYLRIHKVFVGESGARELVSVGEALEKERMPNYLDAAGWAYAEAGLALASESTVGRVELVGAAEDCWRRSIQANQVLLGEGIPDGLYEDSGQFRSALNLAYAPLMKSIIVGNVTRAVRERAFADTLAIAQASAVQMELAIKQQDKAAVAEHIGFIHEANALLTLLYLDDPRYIPLPSTARADTGYYHRDQTHDIMIINQHWGAIKKVIPLEIKASASARDRARYKALIVRGKMHLSAQGRYDPRDTLNAFANVYEQNATIGDRQAVDHASSTMLRLLRLYQQGSGDAVRNTTSATRFHDSRYVAPYYRELKR